MVDYLNDYYVFAARDKDHAQRWHWEIHRKSKPMGIRLTQDGFSVGNGGELRRQACAGRVSECSIERRKTLGQVKGMSPFGTTWRDVRLRSVMR